ncbi:CGG triplet repeat-binding protein 1, partial [Austrofundulus limnaeus]|uniref:CGG triplet repeat-binding protein 1 n=1 Tax=Austrofundulus limnaeus TaxID=52670 RepID=A0A2I4CMY8_AUSLI
MQLPGHTHTHTHRAEQSGEGRERGEREKKKVMAKRLSGMTISSKKLKNAKLSAKFRAEQYPSDFYESGEQLFCKFCQHTIDWMRKNTCDDHLQSKTHLRNKEKKQASARQTHQQTLQHSSTSLEVRREFIEDFVAVCAESDIPLEKMRKLRPFLMKHCKQGGGALPEHVSSLRQVHLPRVFEQHIEAVQKKLQGKKISVVVDETTDARDCSVLNIVVGFEGQYFLMDVIFLE